MWNFLKTRSIVMKTMSGWLKEASPTTQAMSLGLAQVTFEDPAYAIYDQSINLGRSHPGASYGPIQFVLGGPAQAGDTLCFTITLHTMQDDSLHTTLLLL
jgi:hypothetical protein